MRRIAVAAVLPLIVMAALTLRWTNADFGVPEFYHGDEPRKVYSALHVLERATPDVGYYYHPGFLYQSVALVGGAGTVVLGLPLDGPGMLLTGRLWVGLLGALTVLAVFLLARELDRSVRAIGPPSADDRWTAIAGLAAGLFVAVAPLHVMTSHYIKEDVPLALWTTLAAALAVRFARTGKPSAAAGATAFAALALATKWTGGLAFVPVLWVAAARRRRRVEGRTGTVPMRPGTTLLAYGVLAAGVFLVFNAGILLNPLGFLRGVFFETKHAAVGHLGLVISPWHEWWTYHLRESLRPGLTLPLLVVGLIGLALAAWKRGAGAGAFAVFAAVWYLAHEASPLKPPPNADRYMVPLVAMLAATGGLAIAQFGRWLARRAGPGRGMVRASTGAIVVIAVVMAIPAGLRSAELVSHMEPDTRDELARYFRVNVPLGASVLCERYTLPRRMAGLAVTRFREAATTRPDEDGADAGEDGPESIEWPGILPDPAPADYVVTASFYHDRFFDPAVTVDEHVLDARRAYEDLDRRFGPPVAVFSDPEGSCDFNNPTVKVYRLR